MRRNWLLLALLLIPAAVMLGKLPGLPTSPLFTNVFSLEGVPRHMRRHVEYILFVPLSALVVAFFRLTLGIQVLSLFRPILIAIAFRVTGIPIGLIFLIFALGVVALVRPMLKDTHYYARVPVILSLTVTLMIVPLIAWRWWHAEWLHQVAYFPVIALCLTCESFAKILVRQGAAEAVWRAAMTVVVALAVTGIAAIPGCMRLLLRFPELLIAQPGLILLIAGFLDYRLFQDRNLLARGWPSAAVLEAAAGMSTE